MKAKLTPLILVFVIAFSLACQTAVFPIANATATSQPTVIPSPSTSPVPTLEPITERSLAGLLVSSPVMGMAPGPYMGDLPIKGLGIVNQEGQLVKFTDAGIFKGYSPAASYIVYQYYSIDSNDNDKLRAFDAATGQTIIFENELQGEKSILGWLGSSPSKFIYRNSLLSYLFEAYGYFEGNEILLADASTGEVSPLLEHVFQSDLNPDGTELAYTTGEKNQTAHDHMAEGAGCFQPQLFDLATSATSAFDFSKLPDSPLCMGYPRWSPDGKWIAWIGYFSDDTFHTIVFDTSSGAGAIYDPLNLYAGFDYASGWNIQQFEWMDDATLLTDDYQVNVLTGEASPLEANQTYREPIVRPDGLIIADLEAGDGNVSITDRQGNRLASFSLDQLYVGERGDYGFDGTDIMSTYLSDWLPFAPAGSLAISLPEIQPTEVTFSCPGAPRSRVQVGDTARITFTDGTKTRLRLAPESGDNGVDSLPEGTEFKIIDGPVCYPRPGRSDAYIYWKVIVPTRNNVKGWVAEGDSSSYFIEPWP